MAKRVAVIGAGVSGLVAIKHCLEEGLEPVCFEKDTDIGGVWHFRNNPKEGEPSLYSSCVMNTSKAVTCFSDFPFPKEYPNYLHHTLYKHYLDNYTDHFKLRGHIRFQTEVVHVGSNNDETGRWLIRYRNIVTHKETTELFDFVMVCNGHYTQQNRPEFPGLDEFSGRVIHTHAYIDFKGFENKRVLMIGVGNSASDVATEISRFAKQVFMAVRKGALVVQRAGDKGRPSDHIVASRLFQTIPPSLIRPLVYYKVNQRYKLSEYGLSPNGAYDSGSFTLNDDLCNRILVGAITVKPNVAKFTEHDVIFADGTRENDIDIVILGTGYDTTYPFLDESIIKMNNRFLAPLYNLVWLPKGPYTLAVIGTFFPFGPFPPLSEIQSRWATRVFAGRCQLPKSSQMCEEVEGVQKQISQIDDRQVRVHYVGYIDSVAEHIGCKPNLWRYFFTDPKFWFKLLCWPATPPQWRLDGPRSWPGARQAIESVIEESMYPLRTRKAGIGETDGLFSGWIRVLKMVSVCAFLLVLLRTFYKMAYLTNVGS